MSKRVILITGTPCVGKTTVARLLTATLDAEYVNLTELATRENLVIGKDERRNSVIVDENAMTKRIRQIIGETGKESIVVDGHYAISVVPNKLVTCVLVLRRDPVELRKFMEQCGFSEQKLAENLAAEILDVCLVEALNVRGEGRVCELNVTSKEAEEVVKEILNAMRDPRKCYVGVVDWLGKLESEGLLDEYLKI